MRGLIVLLSVFVSASSLHAETLPERTVALLKEACIDPVTPEAMMAAGEKLAATINSKQLSRAMRTPVPVIDNYNGPKASLTSAWDFEFTEHPPVNLTISILGPEAVGFRHSICAVQPSVDVAGDGLVRAVERQLGAVLTKDTSRPSIDFDRWYFNQEKAAGNCGKEILILNHQLSSKGSPKTLMFLDFAYPNDGKWGAAIGATRCRS